MSKSEDRPVNASVSASVADGVVKVVAEVQLQLPPPTTEEQLEAASRGVRYANDYSTVKWGDETFTFTKKQRRVVQALFAARREGHELHQQGLLDAADSDATRLRDLFRDHPAWGSMIAPGEDIGTYRLVYPGEECE
jgi:hypothetical protein